MLEIKDNKEKKIETKTNLTVNWEEYNPKLGMVYKSILGDTILITVRNLIEFFGQLVMTYKKLSDDMAELETEVRSINSVDFSVKGGDSSKYYTDKISSKMVSINAFKEHTEKLKGEFDDLYFAISNVVNPTKIFDEEELNDWDMLIDRWINKWTDTYTMKRWGCNKNACYYKSSNILEKIESNEMFINIISEFIKRRNS